MVLLDVYGADGSLFVNGVPLNIKGVNWFGSESYGGPPGGLTVHTIDFYLDFLQQRGRWREARQARSLVWWQKGPQGWE